MSRKPRIDIPGYYHIINRGVEQRIVFGDSDDYEYFIELLCTHAKTYDITIHNYCLMSNHYHLLIQTQHENLSRFMRQINSNYAVYFNKRYNRVGHLWQGRFKSWYVTDDAYLYTLILYIEQNPLKANMVNEVVEYPYSSAHLFVNQTSTDECLKDSWVMQNYQNDTESIKAFLDSAVDTAQLQELKRATSLIEAPNTDKKPDIKKLQKVLAKAENMKERNKLIVQSYQKGYSQYMIAKVLDVSQAAVYGVIKRSRK